MTQALTCCGGLPRNVIGIDEVGRGSLIGEVTAAAVYFTSDLPEGIKDSKKLSTVKREGLDILIRQNAIVAVGSASVAEIDEKNIFAATLLAMKRAYDGVATAIPRAMLEEITVIVDGDRAPFLGHPQCMVTALVNADNLCKTVGAASIIAKVHRDRLISRMHDMDGRYGWNRNKGYGTKEHRQMIQEHGPSEHHRRSFEPVRSMTGYKSSSK